MQSLVFIRDFVEHTLLAPELKALDLTRWLPPMTPTASESLCCFVRHCLRRNAGSIRLSQVLFLAMMALYFFQSFKMSPRLALAGLHECIQLQGHCNS